MCFVAIPKEARPRVGAPAISWQKIACTTQAPPNLAWRACHIACLCPIAWLRGAQQIASKARSVSSKKTTHNNVCVDVHDLPMGILAPWDIRSGDVVVLTSKTSPNVAGGHGPHPV